MSHRAGEMPHQFTGFSDRLEDLGLIPNTRMVAHFCNFSSGGSDILFWPSACTYLQSKHSHI